jgi:hypothetical protein
LSVPGHRPVDLLRPTCYTPKQRDFFKYPVTGKVWEVDVRRLWYADHWSQAKSTEGRTTTVARLVYGLWSEKDCGIFPFGHKTGASVVALAKPLIAQ